MVIWIVIGILVLLLGLLEFLAFTGWRDLRKRGCSKANMLYAVHLVPIAITIFCVIFNSWATGVLEKIYGSWPFLITLGTFGFALVYILPMTAIHQLLSLYAQMDKFSNIINRSKIVQR